MEKSGGGGRTFLSAIAIGERTFDTSAEKKNLRDGSTFLFTKEIFSIRERTFDTSAEKKIAAAQLFFPR